MENNKALFDDAEVSDESVDSNETEKEEEMKEEEGSDTATPVEE